MRIEAYIDDYTLLQFKIFKPVDVGCLSYLHLYRDNSEIAATFQIVKESSDAYMVKTTLPRPCKYGEVYRLMYKSQSEQHYFPAAKWRHIVATEQFDRMFAYQGDDLGPQYTKTSTTFKVWAPTANQVSLHILGRAEQLQLKSGKLLSKNTDGHDDFYIMERGNKGVYTVTVQGDLDLMAYVYELNFNGEHTTAIDPYSYSCLADASASVVLNPAKFLHNIYRPQSKIANYQDAVIYELSVRDFTMDPTSQVHDRGKLSGMIESNTGIYGRETAFAYLCSLGVTHVQLMPVLDFDSYKEADYYTSYNWGYDPKQYNVVEGSYLAKDTPYARVNDLRRLVNVYHQHDLRVNLDVVFNHVGHADDYAWEKLVPYYNYRYFDEEYLSNGSFCGNELRSEAKMLRKYIVDMCVRYVKIFDIDGLRFDLMGLLDITTMNEIAFMVKKIKPDFMLYGEGWNMPTVLPDDKKAMMYHNYKMPEIGFFNDCYRDTIKGKTSLDQIMDIGYGLGDVSKVQLAKDLLLGSCMNGKLRSLSQSVNYIECHDNMTFYDKMVRCENLDTFWRKQRTKFCLALIMISQGVPFIHCGQEFMRSKGGADNTYNAGDKVNAINWYDAIKNYDVVNYFKELVKLRRRYKEFRLPSNTAVARFCHFTEYYDILLYQINDLLIFINPTCYEYKYQLPGERHLIFADKLQDVPVKGELKIPPATVLVLQE